jgi:hypothetical protein
LNKIELALNAIIVDEISPPSDKREFVESILLNTSIVSFASKVKLFLHLSAAADWPQIKGNAFHRFMAIRNQFAHVYGQIKITVFMGMRGDHQKLPVLSMTYC